MSLFNGTASFYRQCRPGIPAEVADVLVAASVPRRPRRLLDVGTGTGLAAQALLGSFDDVIAIDNDPGMLAAAEETLRPAVPAGAMLRLEESTAEDFSPPTGWTPDLVTICRAFHWLNQAGVLARLDDQVAPDGAVAIFSDNSLWTANVPWARAVRAVVQDFLGEKRRAGTGASSITTTARTARSSPSPPPGRSMNCASRSTAPGRLTPSWATCTPPPSPPRPSSATAWPSSTQPPERSLPGTAPRAISARTTSFSSVLAAGAPDDRTPARVYGERLAADRSRTDRHGDPLPANRVDRAARAAPAASHRHDHGDGVRRRTG